MSVTKRGNVWHVAFRYQDPITGEPRRFRRTTGPVTTKREAEALERQWRREAEEPPPPPAPPVPVRKVAGFGAFAKHWFDTVVKTGCKPSSRRSIRMIIRVHLAPFFGDVDLRDLSAERVEVYKATKVDAELSPKTINNHLTVLRSMLTQAVEWGYCETSPMAAVDALEVPEQPFRFWDADQADAFLGGLLAAEPQWFPLFLTALRTGMRQGELLALTWGDLDFTRREIHVRQSFTEGRTGTPKNGKTRRIPMSNDVARVLRDHRHLRSDLVFCRDDGTNLSANCLWKPMLRGTRRAGLPKIAFHDLRHSFASQLVMKGVPLKAVQEYLGHQNIETTMRYAHLSPGARAGYVNALDTLWPQNGHNRHRGEGDAHTR